jgi:hypothetical protein
MPLLIEADKPRTADVVVAEYAFVKETDPDLAIICGLHILYSVANVERSDGFTRSAENMSVSVSGVVCPTPHQ